MLVLQIDLIARRRPVDRRLRRPAARFSPVAAILASRAAILASLSRAHGAQTELISERNYSLNEPLGFDHERYLRATLGRNSSIFETDSAEKRWRRGINARRLPAKGRKSGPQNDCNSTYTDNDADCSMITIANILQPPSRFGLDAMRFSQRRRRVGKRDKAWRGRGAQFEAAGFMRLRDIAERMASLKAQQGFAPEILVTDRLRSYAAAKAELGFVRPPQTGIAQEQSRRLYAALQDAWISPTVLVHSPNSAKHLRHRPAF